LNDQYRFNDDVCIVGTDEDGNSLEVDELQDQLVEIIDGSTEVKKLVTTLRKDLGENWLFPGDPDFAWEGLMLPNDCQTLLPAIRKVLDVPHDPIMITEYDQYVFYSCFQCFAVGGCLNTSAFVRLEKELRARIGVKWRFPRDEMFVTKEDGSCWEIDVLGHQLETVLEVSSNVKKVISYVRKQLGDDWLFPGDDGYDSEPSGEMKHIRVLLQEIVDFKNCKPADD
jgi:hypothetical protein